MQTELSREKNLRLILQGSQEVGFDRVRVFQFKEGTQSFVCLDSLGMGSPGAFRGYTIFPDRNPYTKQLVETALSQPGARKRDPSTMFGPSLDSEALGKPPALPWVDVPLVIAGKLYGYIAVDNAHSRREITEQSLDYMTLLGALAAQVIANAEIIDRLSVRYWPIFSSQMGIDASQSTVLRRLLVYLTAGEALGFSRALFLRLDERSHSFMYSEGLGSVTVERYNEVGQKAREEGVQRLLTRVDELSDTDLDSAMEGFQLNAEEPTLEELLRDVITQQLSAFSESSRPEWMTDLAHRIGADDLLVVPVKVEKKILGLFVTDRKWQERKLSEADKLALATFARLAAANIALSESERAKERFLQYAFHNLRAPVHSIAGIVEKLITEDDGVPDERQEWLQLLFKQAWRLADLTKQAEAFTRLQSAPRPRAQVSLKKIVKQSTQAFQVSADKKHVHIEPALPVESCDIIADEDGLHEVLQNLLENALRVSRAGQKIAVRHTVESSNYRVSVIDEGPGVPEEERAIIFEEFMSIPRVDGEQEGTGLGLPYARAIVEAHSGVLDYSDAPYNRGACFWFTLPRSREAASVKGE